MKYITLLLIAFSAFTAGVIISQPNSEHTNNSPTITLSPQGITPTATEPARASTWRALEDALNHKQPFERSLAIRQVIANLPTAELKQTYERLSEQWIHNNNSDLQIQLTRNEDCLFAQKLILQRWAMSAPENALPIVEELILKASSAYSNDPFAVHSYKINTDPNAELALAFFHAWQAADASSADDCMTALAKSPNHELASKSRDLLYLLAQKDPRGAYQTFIERRDSELPFRLELFVTALNSQISDSPNAAIQFIDESMEYIPYTLFEHYYGIELLRPIISQNTSECIEAWHQLESEPFRYQFGRTLMAALLEQKDYTNAERLFDAYSQSFDMSQTNDPFAPPHSQLGGLTPVARDYFRSIAANNLNYAMQKAYSTVDEKLRNSAVAEVAKVMASSDPNAALKHCMGLPADFSGEYIGTILAKYFEQDYDQALEKLSTFNPQDWPSDQQNVVLGSMWKQNPLHAIDFVEQIGSPPTTIYTISSSMEDMIDEGQFSEVALLFQRLPIISFGYTTEPYERLAKEWSKQDPVAAVEFGKSISLGESRVEYFDSLATTISADISPEETWALAQAESDDYLSKRLREISLQAMIRSDPSAALSLLNELPQSEARKGTQTVLKEWIRQDSQAALTHIQSLPQSETKSFGVAQYIKSKGSELSFTQSTELLQSISDGKIHRGAAWDIADDWSASNPEKVAEWINEMPQSESRDYAISALADSLSEYDYEQAFAWATTIQDSERRGWDTKDLLTDYAKLDRSAAKALLDESDLSSTEKSKLARELFGN